MSSFVDEEPALGRESAGESLRGARKWAAHLGLEPVPAWIRYPALLMLALVLAKVDWAKAAHILHIQPFALDYLPLWTAGRMALTHPGHLYNFRAITEAQRWLIGGLNRERPWIYPPSALLMFSPLSLASFWSSTVIWVLATVAALAGAAQKFIPRERLLGMVLIAALPATSLTVLAAQTTFLTVCATALGVLLIERRPILAGVLLGLAACLKPTALVFLPLAYLAARSWRPFVATAATGIAVATVTTLWLGPMVWLDWVKALPHFERIVLYDPAFIPSMISPASAGVHLHASEDAMLLLRAASTFAGAGLVWWVWRRRSDPAFRLIALMAAGLLASPYAMRYDAALFVVPAVALICRATSWGGVLTATGAYLLLAWSIQPYAGPYAMFGFFALTTLMAVFGPDRARAHLALAPRAAPNWSPLVAEGEGERAAA
ncbi:glycosyltransferase family 87 protein [Caulobacter sp. KR2-114]|uniref:glycosyltransferase family 87 protein n=1 Tax=Caulobacter sp. KR2-114 TaxID=3400912 RepID=UPI003C06605B